MVVLCPERSPAPPLPPRVLSWEPNVKRARQHHRARESQPPPTQASGTAASEIQQPASRTAQETHKRSATSPSDEDDRTISDMEEELREIRLRRKLRVKRKKANIQ